MRLVIGTDAAAGCRFLTRFCTWERRNIRRRRRIPTFLSDHEYVQTGHVELGKEHSVITARMPIRLRFKQHGDYRNADRQHSQESAACDDRRAAMRQQSQSRLRTHSAAPTCPVVKSAPGTLDFYADQHRRHGRTNAMMQPMIATRRILRGDNSETATTIAPAAARRTPA